MIINKSDKNEYDNPRIVDDADCNAYQGEVKWSPLKSFWLISMTLSGVVGAYYTMTPETVLVFMVTTAITLCLGHSLGMHRRFIHNSYECPVWLEYLFVYLGVLVGLAGPFGMMYTHDLRDWAQRQKKSSRVTFADCSDLLSPSGSLLLAPGVRCVVFTAPSR